MKFKTAISSSILALALVACGSANDESKPDDGKSNLPEKSKECIAAGDNCVLDGDKWVIKDGKDDNKPSNDEAPVADTNFDYSDIGVTDTLEPEKRGFGFWKKGVESPLNAKSFKNNPTQSPIIQWSSKLEYDEDLWNFVAITLDTQDKDAKNKPKYMFDAIGEENQKDNVNSRFFGYKEHNNTKGKNVIFTGKSSLDYGTYTYHWNTVPALVNTFMYRNNVGGWSVFKDKLTNAFLNQENDVEDKLVAYNTETDLLGKTGTGATKLRVYGVNAFLGLSDTAINNFMKTDGTIYTANADKDKETYTLASRSGDYTKHVNFVWYKLSNKGKRSVTTNFDGGIKHAISKFDKTNHPFPTDIEFDVLKYTQFGRLTGEGIDPEADKITGYTDPLLKKYEFAPSSLNSSAGNKKAEDWYFARGTEPTPLATLDNYKKAGKTVVYDGQAVMFGIDYDPRKPMTKEDSKNGQSTNAVKPLDDFSKAFTLLDGKQNLVHLVWDPASGEMKGSVYGVWTQASYMRANKLVGSVQSGNAAKLKEKDGKIVPDSANQVVMDKFSGTRATDVGTLETAEALLTDAALKIEPFFNELVSLDGKVVEGTNSFGGKAVRVKDGSNGLFHGGFFGRDGSEVGGVINSQVGSFKDADLVDPAAKWGGAFGAKTQKTEQAEDLVFVDKVTDYGTSTEFFNTNP